jgi:uncharacterized protein YcbK (DUF882 family)
MDLNKNRFILNFSDFVLNEIKIQNAEEAIKLIKDEKDKSKKEELVKEITKTYFSDDVINGTKILTISEKNQDISVLQSILISYDFLKNHKADGILDAATLEAVKSMIANFKLPITIQNTIPFEFIQFLLEFEEKEPEDKEVEGETKGEKELPKEVPSVTTPSSIILPPSSVSMGEGGQEGINFPLSKYSDRYRFSIQYSKSKDGDKNVSEHIKVKDFACKDGSDIILINPYLVELLEKIIAHYNKKLTIISGYRTPTYNKKIGGAGISQHMFGNAADIRIDGVSPSEITTWLKSFHQGGIGLYIGSKFTHVDVRNVLGHKSAFWTK